MGKHSPQKDRLWQEAQRRHGLSARHVRMARALGLNPKKLGHLRANAAQPWKMPLRAFIEELYRERFPGGTQMMNSDPRSSRGEPRGGPVVERFREEVVETWNLHEEAEALLERGIAGETVIISFGPFVLFSSGTGDAWLLDAIDGDALNLMRGYARSDFVLQEDKRKVSVEWQGTFMVEGDLFVTDALGGGWRAIAGYPALSIADACRRVREG